MERTHLPILSSLHSLPGLVHYIFVNHHENRVRAPTITPLHGQLHRDRDITEKMLTKLKKQVWQLVFNAHEHLAMGHTAMLVRRSDFLYSYRLWVEDDEGVEQVIEKSVLPLLHEMPIGHRYTHLLHTFGNNEYQKYSLTNVVCRFYKDLVHKLFPAQSPQMKCCELYTLYLGILPTALVSKNDRALIGLLLNRNVD